MKLQRKFQPTISGHQLESRTVLSHTGSAVAALTSQVANLATAGRAEFALEARNHLVEGRLTAAGNLITAAASPKSAAARQVLSTSFWGRVDRLDRLQTSLASAIHASDPSRVIQDPIVSNPRFHDALQTLIANNAAWFSSHPSSQHIALDLKYEGDYAGTYTGTWSDSPTDDSGTVTLQITSFRPSSADPSIGGLQGTITITGVASRLPVKGQMTSDGFTLSYSPGDLVGIVPPPFIHSVTITGGSRQSINGAFEFSDVTLISIIPADGKGTLQKVG